ncbi:hypothetical protein [Leucobacter soli]|uniref:hypothetical protein n=1 Tax=Leucobacter soli TaxID=2812850 RepID=UPI00361E17C3
MASGVAVVEDFVGDAVVGDAAVVEAAVDDVSVDEASAGDAAVLAGVLRDGGVLDLLLRLQRGSRARSSRSARSRLRGSISAPRCSRWSAPGSSGSMPRG